MEKQTLKFKSLVDMARFARTVPVGYLMNTNNLTLTAKFPPEVVSMAIEKYGALVIETTDKVYSY